MARYSNPVRSADDSLNVIGSKFRIPMRYLGNDRRLPDGKYQRIAEPDPQCVALFKELRAPGLGLAQANAIIAEYAKRWRRERRDLKARLGRLDAARVRHALHKPDRVVFPLWEEYYPAFEAWNSRRVQLKRLRRPILRDLDYVAARLYIVDRLRRLG